MVSVKELRGEANELGLKGYSKLSKEQLTERLNQHAMLATSQLKERGWTQSMIRDLLGDADRVAPNPHYKSGAEMRLYRTSRVVRAESTEQFQAGQIRRERLKAEKRGARSRRFKQFEERWPVWRDALLSACEFLFNLNRYAKHGSCSRDHSREIYRLKNECIRLLYDEGFCTRCWLHVTPLQEKLCFSCDGQGTRWNGDECWKCGGTGIYEPAGELRLYCFEFGVCDQTYIWHQPANTLEFSPQTTDPPASWNGSVEVKPLEMPRRKFAEGKDLLRWFLGRNRESGKLHS